MELNDLNFQDSVDCANHVLKLCIEGYQRSKTFLINRFVDRITRSDIWAGGKAGAHQRIEYYKKESEKCKGLKILNYWIFLSTNYVWSRRTSTTHPKTYQFSFPVSLFPFPFSSSFPPPKWAKTASSTFQLWRMRS